MARKPIATVYRKFVSAPGKRERAAMKGLIVHIGSSWELVLGTIQRGTREANRQFVMEYAIAFYRKFGDHPLHPRGRPYAEDHPGHAQYLAENKAFEVAQERNRNLPRDKREPLPPTYQSRGIAATDQWCALHAQEIARFQEQFLDDWRRPT